MKKNAALLVAFAMLFSWAAAEADPSWTEGSTWVCGRATIEVGYQDDDYKVSILWGDSAAVSYEWTYHWDFDPAANTLTSTLGRKDRLTWNEDGELTEEAEMYADGQATFTVNEKGMLIWTDLKEDAGKDMEFEQVGFYDFASISDTLKTVYDALTAESSRFSQAKDLYALYYENVTLGAALEENGIAVTLESANEYVKSGAWFYTLEGDCLTAVIGAQDYYGLSFAQNILSAAAEAQGLNPTLLNAYISALAMTGQDNKYFITVSDEAAGTTAVCINITGPYTVESLEGLDEMVLTDAVLQDIGFDPLDENWVSSAVNFGKVTMLVNGDQNETTFLVMEYGKLDDVVFRDILQAVKTKQPKGWENFIANWTELKDAETAEYTVTVNADREAVGQIYNDAPEGYSFVILTFGGNAA